MMHQQVRSNPSTSPANLSAMLQVLLDAGINIVAAGGSHIEEGGEFAFSAHLEDADAGIDEDRTEEARAALEAAGYRARVYDVKRCFVSNEPGQLKACIDEARGAGRPIRDIAVGVPLQDGRIPIQVFVEP